MVKPLSLDDNTIEAIDNDELITLAVRIRREAQRRGIEADLEVWSRALSDEEATRIATEAAAAEAARLRREEARRIAEAATAQVRQAAERQRQEEQAAAAQERAKQLRGIAIRARELFGSDPEEFRVQVWSKPGDQRVYIGAGFDNNWVEYYHTGNSRQQPGTLNLLISLAGLARSRGIDKSEAKQLVLDYCRSLCEGWESLRLDVTANNAPIPPGCRREGWVLRAGSRYGFASRTGTPRFTLNEDKADRFSSFEEAMVAVATFPTGEEVKAIKTTWIEDYPRPVPEISDSTML